MILEDSSCYEGEVAGVGVLGGKGVLKLPNGDVIRGTFHGSWSEGIKMNATLTKGSLSSSSSSHSQDKPLIGSHISIGTNTGQYCVSGQRKWQAIFRWGCQTLDVALLPSLWTAADTAKAWNQIAVAVSQMKKKNRLIQSSPSLRLQSKKRASLALKGEGFFNIDEVDNVAEVLQKIPEYGQKEGQLNCHQFSQVQLYLQKVV